MELSEKDLLSLVRNGAKMSALDDATEESSEVTDILQEMKQLNEKVVAILGRPFPVIPPAPQIPMSPAPVVHVAPPNVTVNPSIVVEPGHKRWKFTVTQRDIQMRIKEIVVETLK